jgi:hypothetical protein
MKLEESHGFPVPEAQERLKLLVENWQRKYGVTATWDGPKVKVLGKAMGVEINALVSIEPNRIVAEGKDPGLLFRSAATGYLKKKFAEYFNPKVTLADLASRS